LAEPQFLPPSTKDALLQGDIFENVPFISIRERPLLVARYRGPKEGREMYGVHKEFDAPTANPGTVLAPSTPFRWEDRDNRELILVPVLFSMAMVLTHDCELKWDDHRLLAMVRPVTELEADQQKQLLTPGGRTDMFPLKAQDVPPTMEASFVDFCNVTPFRTAGLAAPSVRYASASQSLREAVAGAYWYFLHHPFLEERPPQNA
jgi:hypothetical protein